MEIKLLSLHLRNFKSVKDLEINFSPNETGISGDNGTGKTTILDAFTWLISGKNSGDEKDFNVKTLDENNIVIHKLEHEVIGIISVDGLNMKFSRCLKERWQKKRGSEDSEMTGHESAFTYNDVPISAGEFKAKIDGIISEDIFKMVTSPVHFNRMKWQDRRAILAQMAGNISDDELAADNSEFQTMLTELSGKSFIDFKKEIAAKKKKINDELQLIPSRIDEVNRNKPVAADYVAIQNEIESYQKEIENIDLSIENAAKSQREEMDLIKQKQSEKFQLENLSNKLNIESGRLKFEKLESVNKEISKLKIELSDIGRNKQILERENFNIDSHISDIEKEIESLRKSFEDKNTETFTINPNECVCPTCKRELENAEEKKKELEENYNRDKVAKLTSIKESGDKNKLEVESLKKKKEDNAIVLESYRSQIEKVDAKINELTAAMNEINAAAITESDEQIQLKEQVAKFIIPEIKTADHSELKSKKQTLSGLIDGLKKQLDTKEQIEKAEQRIAGLESQEKSMNSEIAQLERREFVAAEFQKKKITEIERRINDKFSLVKWKMFEQQINGGESEVCECLVNGVPFSDLNTASKINAGLDIINAMSNHFNINAPVFVDNCESINELLQTKSQMIKLVVSKEKTLTIK